MGRFLNSNAARPAAWPAPLPAVRSKTPRQAAAQPVQPLPITRLGIVAYFGLAMLVVRIATLPEVLFYIFHINTYLLYLVAPPAILGALFSGVVPRAMKYPAARWWLAFFCLMLIACPFSTWVGGSFARVKDYALIEFPMLFIVVAIGTTWTHVRAAFYAVAAAGLLNVLTSRLFSREDNGRIDLAASGTIGNSNDLASHLMLVLPFILFVAMDARRNKVIRLLTIVPLAYGTYTILGTASRGALIAFAAALLFAVLRGSTKQRIAALAIAGIMISAVPILLGTGTVNRLASIFGRQDDEADESKEARSYLLKQSVIYTLQHPLLGIGPSQFSNFEGKSANSEGRHGEWHETHNAFTEVSSECGIPATICFAAGILSAFVAVYRIYGKARSLGLGEVSNASFCYLLGMVGYLVTIVFLANAYRFYLPTMIGLSIVLVTGAQAEMDKSQNADVSNKLPALRGPFAPAKVRPAYR